MTLASDPTAHAAYKALFTEARWAETIGDIAGFTAAYEATLLRLQADLESGSDLDPGIDLKSVPDPEPGPNPEPVPAPTPGPDPEPARDLQLRSHALAA